MQRNLSSLTETVFDLLIVGGGIYGACVAWEAASRGLSVALVEQEDFGSATSANSLKIIHGGLRYLQHADFKRMRESIRERKVLLRIAPHLIHPLPILVPTYGHGLKGREAMAIALRINDWVSCDRNWSMSDVAQQIPAGRLLSRQACLADLPGLCPTGLTGAALFWDAQVYNSERLTLAFLRSANQAGAVVANYARVTGLLRHQGAIAGAIVEDRLTGRALEIRAQLVINTAGPWIHQVEALAQPATESSQPLLAKAVNLVVPEFIARYAVGLPSQHRYRDDNALIDKGGRFLFTAPWRGYTLVGTWYFPYTAAPDQLAVTRAELQQCLDDVNAAYPPACLSLQEIQYVHYGLLPSQGVSAQTGDVQLAKHYRILDHRHHGQPGLLTVSGVKYTTARDVAEKVVNRAARCLQSTLPPSQTAHTPVWGGAIPQLQALIQDLCDRVPIALSPAICRSLVYNYGTEAASLINQPTVLQADDPVAALQAAQVRHAVRHEMAQHLTDVVLRRTDLGSAGRPSDEVLSRCAQIMASELGWSHPQQAAELEALQRFYAARVPQAASAVEAVLDG